LKANHKLVQHINRKYWWHVRPCDPGAYKKRGKFYASTFREAEFWGRPLDQPEKIVVTRPLVGDEEKIEKVLFGKRVSTDDISIDNRWALDGRMRRAALAKGFDSIVLLVPKAFAEYRATGKLPRSIELNVLNPYQGGQSTQRSRGNKHD
jgi:hypothetical protein